jgi:hypothetical protein
MKQLFKAVLGYLVTYPIGLLDKTERDKKETQEVLNSLLKNFPKEGGRVYEG